MVVEGRKCGIMLAGVELEGLPVGEIAKPQLVLRKEWVLWTAEKRKGNYWTLAIQVHDHPICSDFVPESCCAEDL